MTDRLLDVEGLRKHYPITEGVLKTEVGRVRAVDGISFDLRRGETLGLVGESGCGKSTAATTLLRLEEPTDGDVRFCGRDDDEPSDVTNYSKRDLKQFRRRAQMVFQDPNSSFDPRMTVGESAAEPLRVHGLRRKKAREIVKNLFERVGLSPDDVDRYPHEFSGGQKQRIALARALGMNPELIVADEPVSALDVSVQAEILSLMDDIQEEFGISILLISHDMSVVRQVCDRVAVMYLGEIVELGPTEELFSEPQHPYTRALLASIPAPDPRQRGGGVELTGDVPSPSNPPPGCRFHTRCPEVIEPDGYDFEGDEWRHVLDLRTRLSNGQVELDAIREVVVAEGDAADIGAVSDAQLRAGIRAEYDVPDSLSDSSAETVLSDALDATVTGDFDAADELLTAEFPTVCEQRHPELQTTDAGHPAACHLHDRSATVEAEPRMSSED